MAIDERRGECPVARGESWTYGTRPSPTSCAAPDVVVHLALDLDLETDAGPPVRRYSVRGTQTVLTAAAAAGVHRVVLCTSRDGLRRAAGQRAAAVRGRRAARHRRGHAASATCWRSSGWRGARPARTPAST